MTWKQEYSQITQHMRRASTHYLVCSHLCALRRSPGLVIIWSQAHGLKLGVPHYVGVGLGLQVGPVD